MSRSLPDRYSHTIMQYSPRYSFMVSFLGISNRMVSAACVAMALLLFFAGLTMSGRSPFSGVLFIILSLVLLFAGLSFMGKIRE